MPLSSPWARTRHQKKSYIVRVPDRSDSCLPQQRRRAFHHMHSRIIRISPLLLALFSPCTITTILPSWPLCGGSVISRTDRCMRLGDRIWSHHLFSTRREFSCSDKLQAMQKIDPATMRRAAVGMPLCICLANSNSLVQGIRCRIYATWLHVIGCF